MRLPGFLPVAAFSVQSHGALCGSTRQPEQPRALKIRNGAAVVVAAQAGRVRVSAFKGVAGLFQMVKVKIGAHDVPAAGQTAKAALARESLMRDQLSSGLVPAQLIRLCLSDGRRLYSGNAYKYGFFFARRSCTGGRFIFARSGIRGNGVPRSGGGSLARGRSQP